MEVSTGIAKIVLGDLREIGYEYDDEADVLSRDQILAHNRRIMDGHVSRLKNIMTEGKK